MIGGISLLFASVAVGMIVLYLAAGAFCVTSYAAHSRGEQGLLDPTVASKGAVACFALAIVATIAALFPG
jgi:hypothetical protein